MQGQVGRAGNAQVSRFTPPPNSCKWQDMWFLEVFSGIARLSKDVQSYDFSVEQWDIERGPEFDLSIFVNIGRLFKRMFQLHFEDRLLAIHFGVPCTTWSIARYLALRSRKYLWGKPGLQDKDRKQIAEANKCVKGLLKIMEFCIVESISFIVENRHSSMLWKLPFFRREFESGRLVQVVVD